MTVELGGKKKILGEKKAKPGKSDAGKNWEFGCMTFRSSIECGKNWGARKKGVVGSGYPCKPPRGAEGSPTAVSSCITTYKKTPPPVPPRTTTKPFISITAQSSTESAQDAYMDGQGQRGDIISQSGLSNSTESLDSMKALTAAIEAANAQIHGPASQHMSSNPATVTTTTTIATVTTEDRKKDHFKKNRCLSIGIQVDDAEEPDKTGENKAPSKFQSVGVQVEEEKCFRRFTRSNSVTTAVQADLDFHDNLENSLESIEDNSCPGPMARQFSRDASTSTVSIQGSGNHYHACAADDDFDADFDPSILPPPDPWIDSITEDPLEAVQRSVCHRDGHWFLKLLQAERDRMEGWCQQMEREERENNLPEDTNVGLVMKPQMGFARFQVELRKLCTVIVETVYRLWVASKGALSLISAIHPPQALRISKQGENGRDGQKLQESPVVLWYKEAEIAETGTDLWSTFSEQLEGNQAKDTGGKVTAEDEEAGLSCEKDYHSDTGNAHNARACREFPLKEHDGKNLENRGATTPPQLFLLQIYSSHQTMLNEDRYPLLYVQEDIRRSEPNLHGWVSPGRLLGAVLSSHLSITVSLSYSNYGCLSYSSGIWCNREPLAQRFEEYQNSLSFFLGKIRTAVGSAQLLMAQKFYQFRELCEENLNPNAHPRPTSQDLAGFWDMLQLSIENISMKFDELHQLKANNWKQMDPLDKKERRAPPPVPKKPAKGPAPLIRERSLESSQRQEARKRLMAAKRAASVRQARPPRAPRASRSTSPRRRPGSERPAPPPPSSPRPLPTLRAALSRSSVTSTVALLPLENQNNALWFLLHPRSNEKLSSLRLTCSVKKEIFSSTTWPLARAVPGRSCWAHTRACDFQDLFVCEQELFISEKHPFVSLKVATLSSQQAWLLLLGGSRCCPLGLLPPDTGVHAVTRRPVSTAFRQTAPHPHTLNQKGFMNSGCGPQGDKSRSRGIGFSTTTEPVLCGNAGVGVSTQDPVYLEFYLRGIITVPFIIWKWKVYAIRKEKGEMAFGKDSTGVCCSRASRAVCFSPSSGQVQVNTDLAKRGSTCVRTATHFTK
ncbi:hypothetical protein PANDA_017379 [Ailuropoda melanoleuca]|uniref:DLG associated protein 1 n=1 Tax=Ailuropoda melanoleuca TaxID=9646 RepID=D2HXK8_AILME|nr:hypothetical protein PANDA_017379 [Ailuropoda melanoleuca]